MNGRLSWLLVSVLAVVALVGGVRAYGAIHERARFSARAVPGTVDPRGFRLLDVDPDTGAPVRYDPCTPVAYVVNVDHAPRQGLKDVRHAFDLAGAATGIRFVYEGLTNEVPITGRPPYQPERYGDRWAPVLVGWVEAGPAVFKEHDVGIAGSAYVANDDGDLVYVTGSIALNAAEELSSGSAAGRTWGRVLLHEVGHVVGLDHVDDLSQVMNESLTSAPAAWGVGDEAGLRLLGSRSGCLATPALP